MAQVCGKPNEKPELKAIHGKLFSALVYFFILPGNLNQTYIIFLEPVFQLQQPGYELGTAHQLSEPGDVAA